MGAGRRYDSDSGKIIFLPLPARSLIIKLMRFMEDDGR